MKPKKQENKKKLRYLILFLICMSMFSNGFIFDQPALMKEDIIEKFSPKYGLAKTSFYFSFLYSLYSIPNIILPLAGGFLSDIFGYRRMSVLFLVLIVLGQAIVYLGSLREELKLMVLGRFVFGLGGESIGITSSIILVKWFAGKELSFANALNLSLIRSATVINSILSPRIAEHYGMDKAFGFGFLLTLASLFSLIVLNFLDERDDGPQSKQEQIVDVNQLKDQIISDISVFPKLFWLLTLQMTTFYVSVLLFISFSSSIMIYLWLPADNTMQENQEKAGDLMSIPYMCCTFFSPFIGYMIDKIGQRIKILVLGSCLVFIGLISMLYVYPIFCMICLGIGYSLFGTTIWTSITYVVAKKNLGTAFGVMNSVQNFAFFLMPLFIAYISTKGTQISVVLFFLILACSTLIISIHVYQEDRSREVSLDCNNQDKLMNYLNKSEDDETQEQIIEAS